MITIKTQKDIEILREGGKRHAFILAQVVAAVVPGVTTAELNALAQKLIEEGGDKAAFLNYKPRGASRPYPASLCVSVNDEIVHGIPNENSRVLNEGDIVSLDLGLIHKGLITDAAVTVAVGKIDEESEKLLVVTRDALEQGIRASQPKKTTGDIGFAIESFVRPHGLGVVEELCGHGVGYAVHEDPFIPNYGVKGRGSQLKPGMVIAIEPMLNLGKKDIKLDADGYTYRTVDGSRSAHFEHTILITEDGPEILTTL